MDTATSLFAVPVGLPLIEWQIIVSHSTDSMNDGENYHIIFTLSRWSPSYGTQPLS